MSKRCVSSCNLLHLLRVSSSLVKGNAKQRNITGPVDRNGRKRKRIIIKERNKERTRLMAVDFGSHFLQIDV